MDQRGNGGQWMPLATRAFGGGHGGGVQISNAGTNGFVVADAIRLRKSIPVTIIIDNDEAGATYAGSWSLPSASTSGHHGSGYIHDANAGKGTKTAVFTPNIPVAGNYEVFVRWTSGTNRATTVPIQVISADCVVPVSINQRTGGGRWHSVGAHRFAQGTAGGVEISTTGGGGRVRHRGRGSFPQMVAEGAAGAGAKRRSSARVNRPPDAFAFGGLFRSGIRSTKSGSRRVPAPAVHCWVKFQIPALGECYRGTFWRGVIRRRITPKPKAPAPSSAA